MLVQGCPESSLKSTLTPLKTSLWKFFEIVSPKLAIQRLFHKGETYESYIYVI